MGTHAKHRNIFKLVKNSNTKKKEKSGRLGQEIWKNPFVFRRIEEIVKLKYLWDISTENK